MCKRVGSKGKSERVRRKTRRELRNRIRRAGGKGHGRAFCDCRDRSFGMKLHRFMYRIEKDVI